MFCQRCGTEIPAGENVCPGCGALKPGAKFCQHCGQAIDADCVVCPKCGKQVGTLKTEAPQVIVNNNNTNTNTNVNRVGGFGYGRPKNKWVALLLCIFLGVLGIHKFYEGKIGMGIIYLFTLGLFGIGIIVDIITILLKPVIYYT